MLDEITRTTERSENMSIGDNIKKHMEANGYTQKELAVRCGCTEAAISRYVNNTRTPSINVFNRLVIALGVTSDELLKF